MTNIEDPAKGFIMPYNDKNVVRILGIGTNVEFHGTEMVFGWTKLVGGSQVRSGLVILG